MPMQALEQFEKRIRLFEQMIGKNIEKRVRLIEETFEQKVERPFRLIEQKIGRNIETSIRRFEQKNGIRLNDEVRFIRSWIKKPLSMGAVTPSSKALARNMASYVDPNGDGPVIELGLRDSLGALTRHEVSAVVSGLPLMTKPLRIRLRLLRDALALLQPQAPFVQFTYAVVPPIPKLAGVKVEASERIWLNLPPARVWVYRHG